MIPTNIKRPRNVDWKPIMDASFRGDAARVKVLLAAGADPNVVSATGHRHRPLHRAIEFKKTHRRGSEHEAVVRILLAGGADPKLRGTWSQLTALQLAAIGEWRFVPLLRDYFEPLDIFHAAAVAADSRVGTLLKKDPDVKKYLTDAEIDEQFDLGYHLKHVDTIFKRVFGQA